MKKTKKLLSIILAIAMLVGVCCGCAGKQAENADTSQAGNEQAEETGEETTDIPACTLTYVSWMTKGEDQAMLDGFMEEYPQITVECRAMDGTTYPTDFNTLCLGGDVPDVFLSMSSMISDLVKNGYIQPITNISGVEKQSKNASVNASLSVNGEVYGYAINGGIGAEFVYYNADIFKDNNLKVPTTVEEFEALCAQIKNLGIDPLIVPAGDTWNAMYCAFNYYFKAVADCGSVDDHAAELALLKGEILPSDLYGEAFRAMQKYYDNGWISEGGLSMGWETATQYFLDDNAAMIVTGNWLPGSDPVAQATDFNMGCFPMPGIPSNDGTSYTQMGVDRILCLSANSENAAAAQALFEYIIRDDVLSEYLTSQGLTGVNIDVPVNEVFTDAIATLSSDAYTLSLGLFLPDMPTGWNNNLSQYSADIFSGANVDELLQKLDDEYAAAMSTVDVQSYIDALSAN